MTTLLVVLAAGVGTYLLRSSPLVALIGRDIPARTRHTLTFVGPAAVAALVASSLAAATTTPGSSGLPELAAAATAFGVVRRTGRVVHAVVVGLPVLWALEALGLG